MKDKKTVASSSNINDTIAVVETELLEVLKTKGSIKAWAKTKNLRPSDVYRYIQRHKLSQKI